MMKQVNLRITVLLLSVITCMTAWSGCAGRQPESTASTEAVLSGTLTETAETEVPMTEAAGQAEPVAETQPPTTEHISPRETVTAQLGTQIDVDAVLDRDSAADSGKNYKTALSQFIQEGDAIASFTFVFYAADGVSSIGTYKGGCGISVSADCPAATNKGWYQSDDFTAEAQGAYVEVTWNVPESIRDYIPSGGDVQIGYWWGDTQEVRLQNIICTYTHTEELPVDGTETISVGKTLRYSSDTENSVKVSLGDVLGEEGIPQAVTFDFHADSAFRKFTGAFGVTTSDWYMSDTVAVLTDSSALRLTWVIPEEVRSSIPSDAEVMLGYWWGEPETLTLDSVTVQYAIGGVRYTLDDSAEEEETEAVIDEAALQAGREKAAALVSQIKVGWNLGNALDCYDTKSGSSADYETLWGNPKTTKAMIDAVKAKGFNAIRIPISWTNHIEADGTVDASWMARVQEVVDYAVQSDLYTIINVHHDDYTWLNPTRSDEAEVTAKYAKLWEQIAKRFKDYDDHLLFEGLNEPRVIGSANEWTGGTTEERIVINHLLKKFVEVVRASGGNNAERTLIVTTHAASITEKALDGLQLPNDGNIVVSVHNYAPWELTTKDFPEARSFDSTDKYELNAQFDRLYEYFVSKGIPVIIGEFGAEDKDNTIVRSVYYSYYVSAAAERNIPCFIWDSGAQDSYGLFNRKDLNWYYEEIADAVMNQFQ